MPINSLLLKGVLVFFRRGAGSADFIFMGVGIFPTVERAPPEPHLEASEGWIGLLAAHLGAKKSTQTFFVQTFSTALRVVDVRSKNRGRPHQKVRFAPVVGTNFLTPGHPGVRVRNVRGKSGPKSLCLCCFLFPDHFLLS